MKRKTAGFLLVTLLLCLLCTACGGKSDKDAFAAFAGEWTAVTSSVYDHLVIHEDGRWELYENEGTYTSGELDYHSDDDSVWISPGNNSQWSRLNIEDDGSLYIGPLGTFCFGYVPEESIPETEEEWEEVIWEEDPGDDWRSSGVVVSSGTITHENEGSVYVLVTVDENSAAFYRDESEQILFDSVAFPVPIPDAQECFSDISFDDMNGDGESDVSVSFVYPSGEYTWLAWIWDPEERYVFQWDSSIFEDSGDTISEHPEYWGCWEYPDGTVLEISEDGWWYLYEAGEYTPFAQGPAECDEDAAYLMNADGSSGGGVVYLDDDANLIESDYVLTWMGMHR